MTSKALFLINLSILSSMALLHCDVFNTSHFLPHDSPQDTYINTTERLNAPPDTIRFMTWNIQCGFPDGMDPFDVENIGGSPIHLNDIADCIQLNNAHIVALQEVGENRPNQVVESQIVYLSERLNMNYAFAEHGPSGVTNASSMYPGKWGNAILSKFPIERIESKELIYRDVYDTRRALKATIRISEDQNVDVISIHFQFDTKPPYDSEGSALIQTASLMDLIETSENPLAILGDFNWGIDWPGSPMPTIMSDYDDAYRHNTSQDTLPWRIDYLLFEKAKFDIIRYQPVDTSYWHLSDHVALMSDVLLK